MNSNLSIPETSTTLLAAIANDLQSDRWYDFYNRYRPVMEGYLKTAFPTLEADDVIQDAMLVLMKRLPDYHYDPDAKGHFRNYLIGIVRFKAIATLKRRRREEVKMEALAKDDGRRDLMSAERIDDEELREWRHHAYEVALAQLMSDEKIQARSRLVFSQVVVEHKPPEAVAKAYGITRNGVDQIKNRLLGKLRERIGRMIEEDSDGHG